MSPAGERRRSDPRSRLRRRAFQSVHHFRVKICAVGPNDRVAELADDDRREDFPILQRLEDRAAEDRLHIHVPHLPVGEQHSNDIPVKRSHTLYRRSHHASGSIRFGASDLSIRAQLSPSSPRCSSAHWRTRRSTRGGKRPSTTSPVSIATRVVLAVSDVEVRGRMVLHKHADHDAIEDADRGHHS